MSVSRVDIIYSGKPYSVGGRTVESLRQEVNLALAAGVPYWLRVNSGEGRLETAYLLVATGIPIAFIDVKGTVGADLEQETESMGLDEDTL